MLTQDERDAAMTWRARAAAELQSIREDGLLGRNWRKHRERSCSWVSKRNKHRHPD